MTLNDLLIRYGNGRADDGSLTSLRECVEEQLRNHGRDALFSSLRVDLGVSTRVANLICEAAVSEVKP